MVFVHDISRDGSTLSKVFLAQQATEQGMPHSVVYAETGQVKEDSTGAQRLVLSKGRRYAGAVDAPEYDVLEFGRYHLQIREQQVEQRRRKLKSLPTIGIIYSSGPTLKPVAEWHWRLGDPAVDPNFDVAGGAA